MACDEADKLCLWDAGWQLVARHVKNRQLRQTCLLTLQQKQGWGQTTSTNHSKNKAFISYLFSFYKHKPHFTSIVFRKRSFVVYRVCFPNFIRLTQLLYFMCKLCTCPIVVDDSRLCDGHNITDIEYSQFVQWAQDLYRIGGMWCSHMSGQNYSMRPNAFQWISKNLYTNICCFNKL